MKENKQKIQRRVQASEVFSQDEYVRLAEHVSRIDDYVKSLNTVVEDLWEKLGWPSR